MAPNARRLTTLRVCEALCLARRSVDRSRKGRCVRRRFRKASIPASIVLPPRWRRNKSVLILVAIVLAGLFGVRSADRKATTGGGGEDFRRYHDQTFRVARVVDGDTFDIDAPDGGKPVTRIRLWGVDCPETGHGRKPSMHFGDEAKAFVERTLGDRSVHVVLSPKRTRGKYGRLLAYVFLERGGEMFNEMLLAEGYAYADRRFPHHYKKAFETIEQRARRSGAGLWADVTVDKMPAWKQRFERSGG